MALKRFSADISFLTETGYSSSAKYRTAKPEFAEQVLLECAREIHMIAVRSGDQNLMDNLESLFAREQA